MKVKDCMCDNVDCVKPDTSVKDCAKIMCEKHIGCTPVCDSQNNLVGIITDRDILLRAVACDKDTASTPVSQIMTTKPFSCTCNQEIQDAEKLMAQNQVRRIPVVENDKVIGILTLGDLAADQRVDENELCNTVECICGTDTKNAD